jgi:RHS repeat-associated protein
MCAFTVVFTSCGRDTATRLTARRSQALNRGTNTFDAKDRLTASGSVTYGYDDNGNLTSRTEGGVTTTYGYDSLNRLTSVTGGTSYSYNGDGLRVGKTVASVTTDFTWDPTGIGTLLSDGDDYLWGAGLIGRIDTNDDATYAHQDGLGSIRLITDDTGAVVGSTAYDAYGEQRATSGVQYRLGYTGEQLDAETGFVYLRARYYDPGQGRFLTTDPFPGSLVDPLSLHSYLYVHNNPANAVDPTGQWITLVAGAIGAATGAAVSIGSQYAANGGDASAIDWGDVGVAAGVGFLAGAAAPTFGMTMIGAVAIGTAANVVQYTVTQISNGESVDTQGILTNAATGAIGGRIGGPFTRVPAKYDVSELASTGIQRAFRSYNRDAQLSRSVRVSNLSRTTLAAVAMGLNISWFARC